MATGKTVSGVTATLGVTNFPAVINDINLEAYKLQYENNLLRHLCKSIGGGQKGGWLHFPYFDPTAFATAASALTEADDFGTSQKLVNASVIIVASEFGLRTDITDRTRRAAKVDIVSEASRQLGIGVALKMDLHILGAMSAGFTTGTVTGTSATDGFTYAKYAAAQSRIAAKALTVPGTYNAVVPEYSWFYTAKSTWADASSTGGIGTMGAEGEEILRKYHKKRILGNIDVYTLPINYMAATSLATGYMFSSEGLGLWVDDDFHVEQQRDASGRLDEFIASMTGGAKVLIGGYGARLRLNASAPS